MRKKKKGTAAFRDMRIQTKITLCIFLVVAIPLSLGLLLFSKPLYAMITASTISDEQNTSAIIAPEIEERANDPVEKLNGLSGLALYQRLFRDGGLESMEELVKSSEAAEFRECVREIEDNSQIKKVKIYLALPERNAIFRDADMSGIFRPEDDIISTYWHGIFSGSSYADLHCPEFYLSGMERDNFGNLAYIKRESLHYQGRIYPAYVALYYDNSVYSQVLQSITATEGSVCYIINNRDALVVSTDRALAGTYRIKYRDIRAELLASNSFVEREVAGISVLVAFHQIQGPDWFMVNVIPKDQVVSIAKVWMKRFVFICVACAATALIIAVSFSRLITRRLEKVSRQMSKVHDGPPVAMNELPSADEIGELIESYNYMTNEMNNLIRKQEEIAQELRIAEFNAFQAQIKPHFLYNTMDMINWMALQGRNQEVSEAIQNLSKFYKLTLSRKNDYSTIADELEHARVYMELQNKRFGDAIEFVVDVPDELMECRMPKLTLQPILENAILHGILEKEEKTGTVVLTAWSENDDIKFLISDDGAGMDENVLSAILSEERITPANPKGSRVAIINIHRRMQLLYGERYGLKFQSSPGEGCEVTIFMPKHIGPEPYKKVS